MHWLRTSFRHCHHCSLLANSTYSSSSHHGPCRREILLLVAARSGFSSSPVPSPLHPQMKRNRATQMEIFPVCESEWSGLGNDDRQGNEPIIYLYCCSSVEETPIEQTLKEHQSKTLHCDCDCSTELVDCIPCHREQITT